jgi:hypothetical protein
VAGIPPKLDYETPTPKRRRDWALVVIVCLIAFICTTCFVSSLLGINK